MRNKKRWITGTLMTTGLAAGLMLIPQPAQASCGACAQGHAHVQAHRGGPPPWAPAHGARAKGKGVVVVQQHCPPVVRHAPVRHAPVYHAPVRRAPARSSTSVGISYHTTSRSGSSLGIHLNSTTVRRR